MVRRLVFLVAITTFVGGLYFSGSIDNFTDEQQLRALLTQTGIWGPVVFVALFAVLEGLGAPGFVFLVTASLIWPFWQASLLALAGAVSASIIGFTFARYVARDLVEAWLPPSVRRFDERLAANGFVTVLMIRLVFFIAPWAHWALGLSRVRFVPFVAGTALGLIPGTLVTIYLGREGFEWLMAQEVEVITGTAVFIAAGLGARWWWRRSRRPVLANLD
jgi:uncharacterized membrane protein YdjX (TVP38/TMEM64 family)